jgi:NADPH-dependent ferric siderophore reductase
LIIQLDPALYSGREPGFRILEDAMPAESTTTRRNVALRVLDPLLDRMFVHARVTAIEQPTPRMRQITLTGPGLGELAWVPGQQIRVRVRDLTLRTYSVWSRDTDRLALCVLDHGDGPGAAWGRTVKVGDDVDFRGPEGRLVADVNAAYHLFVGEETAAVAFGAIIDSLADSADSAEVHGVGEVATADDVLPIPGLTWQYRGAAPAADSESLVSAVRALALPDEPGVAYVAGEARTCQAVRAHLTRDRGWPRRSVVVKPFWAPGKRGLE